MVDDVDEYQTLQQMLEANNIYEPRMQIEEMRTLCAMIETAGPVAQPEVGSDAASPEVPSENDTIAIVKQLFENHRNKLQPSKGQSKGVVSLPDRHSSVMETITTQEGTPAVEQQLSPHGNENHSQQEGCGRKLRKRVPRNYASQMEQTETRRQPRRQQDSEEYKELRRFLKERDLYKPPMGMEEMRAVCQAIEQSMQDMNHKQREPEYESWTYFEHPHREPLRDGNWQQPSDLNPIFVDYVNEDQNSDLSPPSCAVDKSPELLESPPASKPHVCTLSVEPNVDSDSETEYSLDNPGPCCKVMHVVYVEVHPEPRENRPDESPQKICAKLNSSLLSRSVPTDAWDAIDEFF